MSYAINKRYLYNVQYTLYSIQYRYPTQYTLYSKYQRIIQYSKCPQYSICPFKIAIRLKKPLYREKYILSTYRCNTAQTRHKITETDHSFKYATFSTAVLLSANRTVHVQLAEEYLFCRVKYIHIEKLNI